MRLIDADALIETFEDRLEKIRNRYGDYSGEAGVCAGALHLIREQPTIEPKRKTGKWIDRGYMKVGFYCSECGGYVVSGKENFCPNCGSFNGDARNE